MLVEFKTNTCRVNISPTQVERIVLEEDILEKIRRRVQSKCQLKNWGTSDNFVTVTRISCMPSDKEIVQKLKFSFFSVLFTIEIKYNPNETQEFFLFISI